MKTGMTKDERALQIGAALERLTADGLRASADIAEALACNPVTQMASGPEALRAFAETSRERAERLESGSNGDVQ